MLGEVQNQSLLSMNKDYLKSCQINSWYQKITSFIEETQNTETESIKHILAKLC